MARKRSGFSAGPSPLARLDLLAKTEIGLFRFMLNNPEDLAALSGNVPETDPDGRRKSMLMEHLQNYAEATRDVCCYCDGRVVSNDGERVCERCGAVQPVNTIRIPTIYYRRVQNFSVWNKNLDTDPVQSFNAVKAILANKDKVMIRSPTDPRFLGDPEDLVLRDLLGFFSWLGIQKGLPPHIIHGAAGILRKYHRKKMRVILDQEKREAMLLLAKIQELRVGKGIALIPHTEIMDALEGRGREPERKIEMALVHAPQR
jgi:hypothetical protein